MTAILVFINFILLLNLLVIARIARFVFPFSSILKMLGQRSISTVLPTPELDRRAGYLQKAMYWINRMIPVPVNCLLQVMAIRWLALAYGIPGTAHVGVRKKENGTFDAHAWYMYGKKVICGGGDLAGYELMGSYH